MANLDFKTATGEAMVEELIKEIFRDFDKKETTYTDYSFTVTVDNAFEFMFTSVDELMKAKRLITLIELKKLDRLTNCKCGECKE